MITTNKENVILEFGNGDICIAGGYTKNEGGTYDGLVIFANQAPREIGEVGDIQAGEVDLEEYPIIMTFSKKESIDVIIDELEKAKLYIDLSNITSF